MYELSTTLTDRSPSIMADPQIVPLISEFKKRVVAYATSMGFEGFCDPEINQFWSYRTRRSFKTHLKMPLLAELTREGVIVNSGRTRTYGRNRKHIIWVHKDYQ